MSTCHSCDMSEQNMSIGHLIHCRRIGGALEKVTIEKMV